MIKLICEEFKPITIIIVIKEWTNETVIKKKCSYITILQIISRHRLLLV